MRYSVIVIAIFLFGIITPYSSVFLGLALGTFVGLINFILMVRMVNRIGEIAANTDKNKSKKPVFSGMTTRFATAVLAVMIVYKFPELFNLISTLFGLLIVQIISIVDGVRNL